MILACGLARLWNLCADDALDEIRRRFTVRPFIVNVGTRNRRPDRFRAGNWALEPEYDYIVNDEGFWHVGNEERYGLYTAALEPMFPVENTNIYIYNGTITVRHADHIARQYDYAGNLLNPFLIDGVESMMYETTEMVSDGRVIDEENCEEVIVPAIANRLRYQVSSENWHTSDYYGLLGRDGRIATSGRCSSGKQP